MGTYDRPDKIYEMVDLSPEPLRSYMKELIEMRMENPILPMEGIWATFKDAREDLPDDKFSLFMNADVFRGCLYQRLFPQGGGG